MRIVVISPRGPSIFRAVRDFDQSLIDYPCRHVSGQQSALSSQNYSSPVAPRFTVIEPLRILRVKCLGFTDQLDAF